MYCEGSRRLKALNPTMQAGSITIHMLLQFKYDK